MNVVERLAVSVRQEVGDVEHLPQEVQVGSTVPRRLKRERRRTVADQLYARVVKDGESFWTAVYPLYMSREITKNHVKDIVDKGLTEAHGNYKVVTRLFNMEEGDYKRFLNFLRKHQCQLPYRQYR